MLYISLPGGSPGPVSRFPPPVSPLPAHRSLSFPPTPIETRDNPPDTAHGGHANSHDFLTPPRDWRHRSCRCRLRSSARSLSSSTPSRSSPLRRHRAPSRPSSILPAMTLSSDCSPSSCCPSPAASCPASAPATAPSHRPRAAPSGAETSTPARYASSYARTCTSTTTSSLRLRLRKPPSGSREATKLTTWEPLELRDPATRHERARQRAGADKVRLAPERAAYHQYSTGVGFPPRDPFRRNFDFDFDYGPADKSADELEKELCGTERHKRACNPCRHARRLEPPGPCPRPSGRAHRQEPASLAPPRLGAPLSRPPRLPPRAEPGPGACSSRHLSERL